MASIFKTKRSGFFIYIKLIVPFFIVSTLSTLITPSLASSNETYYQLTRRDKLFALHFCDKETGWAVGNRGLLLRTANGGNNWVRLETVPDKTLNDITFVGNKGWIVGENGLVLHSNDDGYTWNEQSTPTESSLMQVCFLDEHNGFAVGKESTILFTKNGGSSWMIHPLDIISLLPRCLIEQCIFCPNLYDIFFVDRDHGWIVGANGIMLSTSNGGETWGLLQIGDVPNVFSVSFKNILEGWAVGQNGLFIHTENGGQSWSQLETPVEVSLFKINMAGSYGIVVGDLGTALQTIDGGKTWNKVELNLRPPLPWLLDVNLTPKDASGEVLCVGQSTIKQFPYK